ncbi:hypothetical protein THAOC_00665 [Thalassiosira oceanica]|uniref:Uncharacterized protein n=1 Tax=Thalassiosira oceanica TaxID=159749 RepID=K0TNY5_THAOC|nr:hypothetical protein THAOC_00665 [Thalassiosira oceanica]|eukprot:EJK77501.1 hypothetical protein THAOC_00665 [Thalassiosira oceanica]
MWASNRIRLTGSGPSSGRRNGPHALPEETTLISKDVIGYFSKETMEAELYSIARDMAMFNPPGELGVGILDKENSVVCHL